MCTQKLSLDSYWTSESLSHLDLPGPWASVTVNQVNLNPSIITPSPSSSPAIIIRFLQPTDY